MVQQKELISYTSSADIGVLFIQADNKSKDLTLPNKVFEYMNAGIPYVTNNRTESSRIIKENNCGFIFNDQTPELIAKQFKVIIKKDLRSLGENGRKAIENKILQISTEIIHVLHDLKVPIV